jgi:hypothetical protein
MEEIRIEQALFGGTKPGDYRVLGRSAGFGDEWLTVALELLEGFGTRPTGVACPAAVFAQPFGKQHAAIVQVADLSNDELGRPAHLGFRILVLPRKAFADWITDPFLVGDRFPPPWQARGDLPTLSWPLESIPTRSVSAIQAVLRRPDSPVLLGGVQSLVDGARLVFERAVPDGELVRSLWALLPTSTRGHLWPATFAFGNALGFDALVVPDASDATYAEYLTEEQAANYPEGRYELNLQIAAEASDQGELDRLFLRRSRTETWRLGLLLLVIALSLALAMKLLMPAAPPPRPPAPAPAKPATERHGREAPARSNVSVAGLASDELPRSPGPQHASRGSCGE